MKKYIFAAALLGFALYGADLELKLNEGDVKAVRLTGDMAKAGKVRIINGKNIAWETGRDGRPALVFKNVTAKGKIPSIGILLGKGMDLSKPFTWTCWVKPDAKIKRPTHHEVFSNCHSDRGPGPRMTYGWSKVFFMSGDGKKAVSISSNSSKNPVRNGAWNHLAAVWDGKTAKIYINGFKASETSVPMIFRNGEKELYIGSYRGGYANGLNGAFSDVKIWFRALDDKAICREALELE